ncbi:MAG: hypothetical protein PWQ25_1438 [Deferribacteres bacterium]|nr:hypothetical protein [Deferribacteraceae bacterium]MDK2792575.1 hypothetical protein [Deferribacteres bacterium]
MVLYTVNYISLVRFGYSQTPPLCMGKFIWLLCHLWFFIMCCNSYYIKTTWKTASTKTRGLL